MPLSPKLISATLINRQQLNDTYYQLTLKLSEPIDFQPGQYLNLKLDHKFRAYSIASLPRADATVDLCIDARPGGIGSQFASRVALGTTVSVLLPLGQFVLSPLDLPSVFIATGSGIAPFKAMIQGLLNRQTQTPVRLLWGMRFEKELFWEEVWSQFQSDQPQFNYTLCLSREIEPNQQPNNPHRFYSRVTKLIKKTIHPGWQAYLCGNRQMIDMVTQLLTQIGLNQTDIHFEKFY